MPTNGKITGQDIIDQSAISQVEKLDAALRKILQTYNDIAKSAQNATNLKQLNEALAKRNKNDKDAIDISTKLAKLKKEEANAEAAKERAIKAGLQTQKLQNQEERKAIGTRSTNLSQIKSLNSVYQQQSRLLNTLRDRYKSLEVKKQLGIKLTNREQIEYKKLGNQVRVLNQALVKTDAAAGQFNRNVGNYAKGTRLLVSSLRSLAGAFGFTSGIFLFAAALRNSLKIVKEFDQGQADLAAILGRSKKEISDLTDQAKELGATTAFTATEVSKLQLELAKLGFTDREILGATEAIENLAIATGVDAARAAKLAGASLRGFNLEVSESNRVASVLAVATTKSASSFETLEVALPKVSAIAKAFNFSIEDTVALLSSLQNAGFEASIAGTSLRQIFLQLADENGDLAKRLGGTATNLDELVGQFKRLEDEGINLSEAFNLTNARSVAAFKVFLQGADDIKTLRDGVIDVEGELKQLADTKLDSLQGDITLLNSAWEGLVISIEDGNGEISRFIRGAVVGLTGFLEELRRIEDAQSDVFNAGQRGYLEEIERLKEIKNSANTTAEEYDKISKRIAELTVELNNAGIETSGFFTNQLLNARTLGAEIPNIFKTSRFELIETQEEFNRLFNAFSSDTSIATLFNEIKRLNDEITNNSDLSEEQIKLYEQQKERVQELYNSSVDYRLEIEGQAREIVSVTRKFDDFGRKIDILTNEQLEEFIKKNQGLLKSLKDINEEFDDDEFDSLNSLNDKLKELKELFNSLDVTSPQFQNVKKEIADLEAEIARIIGSNRKNVKVIIEDTIEAYNEEIKKLKQNRDETAKTTEEYQKFEDQIFQVERKIKALKEGVDALNKVEDIQINANVITQGSESPSAPNAADIEQGITEKLAKEKARQEGILDAFNRNKLEDLKDATEEEIRVLTNALNLEASLVEQNNRLKEDFIFASVQSVFDTRVAAVDKEIEQLNRQRNAYEDSAAYEKLTDEQKVQSKLAFDAQEAQLEQKREKREKAAFLVQQGLAIAQIAIDLAKTIAAINAAAAAIDIITPFLFGAAGASYRATNLPIAIGSAALQTGVVLAQTIPAFFKGKDASNNYEGMATVNELPGQRELKVDKYGGVSLLKAGMHTEFIGKDDLIIPSMSDFNRQIKLPDSDLSQRFMANITNDTRERVQSVSVNNSIDLTPLKGLIEREISRGFSKAKININNKIINESKYTKY